MMKPPSGPGADAARRLPRLLSGIVAQVEGDLRRMNRHPAESVHALRRRIKKLGAILRLVRKHVPARSLERLKESARLLKDAFAISRDREVMRKLCQDLGIPPEAVDLGAGGEPSRPGVNTRHRKAARELREELMQLTLESLTRKQIGMAFRLTWKKERKAWKHAKHQRSAEALHAWRKQVKTLYFQMLFLCQRGGGTARTLKLADRLGHRLGRHHDLEVLASRLWTVHPDQERWLDEIHRWQTKLTRRIFADARRFHDMPLDK